jgi:hypothetical protein
MLARPGLGQHEDSSTAPGTPWQAHSTSASGISTPNTPKKYQVGVDPGEVARRLRRLKEKVAHSGDSKQAKYIQAKADLAHRRNLVLLMVGSPRPYSSTRTQAVIRLTALQ